MTLTSKFLILIQSYSNRPGNGIPRQIHSRNIVIKLDIALDVFGVLRFGSHSGANDYRVVSERFGLQHWTELIAFRPVTLLFITDDGLNLFMLI